MVKILFKEEQRFTQWWLWLFLIGIGLIPIVGLYNQIFLGEEFGDNHMSNFGLIIFSIFTLLFIALFRIIKLKTEISTKELNFALKPFVSRKVNLNDIASVKIVDYGFVGGWGIRKWTSFGTVYNIKGKIGLAIELKNGSKFLIGTQKETELKNVIKEIIL